MRAFLLVVLTAGPLAAAPPQTDGREATPVEREFYLPPPAGNVFPRPMPPPAPRGLEDEVRDVVRGLLAKVGF